VRAQLRDVLPTENSAVVAQKDNYCGLAEPQGAQAKFPAVEIREVNHRQTAVECYIHISHFDYPQLPVKSAPDTEGKLDEPACSR